jgi:DNA excision repair protein ERCC-5
MQDKLLCCRTFVQVCLAMLLGSDYTEGVAGIGVVNALEVVSAWPDGLTGLAGFKQWLDSPDERILAAAAAALRDARGGSSDKQPAAPAGSKKGRGSKGAGRGSSRGRGRARGRERGRRAGGGRGAAEGSSSEEDQLQEEAAVVDNDTDAAPAAAGAGLAAGAAQQDTSARRDSQQEGEQEAAGGDTPAQRRFKTTHRGIARSWHLPAAFPNSRVHDAYLQPLVDRNPAKFNFGRPNGDMLTQFCRYGGGMALVCCAAHSCAILALLLLLTTAWPALGTTVGNDGPTDSLSVCWRRIAPAVR